MPDPNDKYDVDLPMELPGRKPSEAELEDSGEDDPAEFTPEPVPGDD